MALLPSWLYFSTRCRAQAVLRPLRHPRIADQFPHPFGASRWRFAGRSHLRWKFAERCQWSKCAKHSRRSHVLCPSILLPSPSRLLAGNRFECRTAALSRSTTRVNCLPALHSHSMGISSAKSTQPAVRRGSGRSPPERTSLRGSIPESDLNVAIPARGPSSCI